jgi:hypothetical protein
MRQAVIDILPNPAYFPFFGAISLVACESSFLSTTSACSYCQSLLLSFLYDSKVVRDPLLPPLGDQRMLRLLTRHIHGSTINFPCKCFSGPSSFSSAFDNLLYNVINPPGPVTIHYGEVDIILLPQLKPYYCNFANMV